MKKLLIANWKMQLTHDQACTWLEKELPSIKEVVSTTKHTLVICPSFTVLDYATSLHEDFPWGAQDCGFEKKGSYTGDVSPASLKQLGIRYTLVGHSERRRYHGETDERVAQKTALLLEEDITPVICIGETAEELTQREVILKRQLEQILPLFEDTDQKLHIAYEPVWAIGTGQVPSAEDLEKARNSIKLLCGSINPKILYGGSVNEHTAGLLSPLVEGFLIGSASLDSAVLKKIILSC